jgi:hypothetical protein
MLQEVAQATTQVKEQFTGLGIASMMSLAGAFGGMLDVLQLIEVRRLIEQKGALVVSKRRFIAALLLGCVGGIGGVFAMIFTITATSTINTDYTPRNQLLLFSLGVVSGFW